MRNVVVSIQTVPADKSATKANVVRNVRKVAVRRDNYVKMAPVCPDVRQTVIAQLTGHALMDNVLILVRMIVLAVKMQFVKQQIIELFVYALTVSEVNHHASAFHSSVKRMTIVTLVQFAIMANVKTHVWTLELAEIMLNVK